MNTTSRQIAVWLARDIPTRLIWDGKRYRVSDMPTPLDDDVYWVTHPPPLGPGWRLQGTTDAGETHMFEIRQVRGEWQVVRVYD